MKDKQIRVLKAARHGAFVTATGDLTRLRTLRKNAERSNYVQEAWAEVGKAMMEAATTTSSSRPSSPRRSQR